VLIATNVHWHVLCTIHACQAGKDVYVEKPLCHFSGEGPFAIAAAKKYDRIVQIGTNQHSCAHYRKAEADVEVGYYATNVGQPLHPGQHRSASEAQVRLGPRGRAKHRRRSQPDVAAANAGAVETLVTVPRVRTRSSIPGGLQRPPSRRQRPLMRATEPDTSATGPVPPVMQRGPTLAVDKAGNSSRYCEVQRIIWPLLGPNRRGAGLPAGEYDGQRAATPLAEKGRLGPRSRARGPKSTRSVRGRDGPDVWRHQLRQDRGSERAHFPLPVRDRRDSFRGACPGRDVAIVGLCGAAGDQSPHLRYQQAADDDRMRSLRKLDRLQEIARRIVHGVAEAYEVVQTAKQDDVVVKHHHAVVVQLANGAATPLPPADAPEDDTNDWLYASSGSYLPSERAVKGGGYGAVI